VIAGLAGIGLPVDVPPDGAFYAWFDVRHTGLDAWTFCQRALQEAHVALTPGRDFSELDPERHVRLSCAASTDDLTEGLSRLGRFVADLRP
jgi:aspartate/methionine/tyrosine aminotransferase